MMRPTTKHSHIGKVSDIKPGVYFKTHGEWFRARDVVRLAGPAVWEWEVPALDSAGLLHVRDVLLGGDEVELADDGHTPGPFQPARVRAKARRLERQAVELQRRARQLHQFADISELEAKLTKGAVL
jgi:hypothetical protein